MYEQKLTGLGFFTVLIFPRNRCDRTAWYSMFIYVICTLLAQVVLTLRLVSFFWFFITPELIPRGVDTGYMP